MENVQRLTNAEWRTLALAIADKGQELSDIYRKVVSRAMRYQITLCGLFGVGEVEYIGGYDDAAEAESIYRSTVARYREADEMLSVVLVDSKLGKIIKQSIN